MDLSTNLPQTFAQKALARAAGLATVEVGQVVDARPDVVLSHDNTAAIREIWLEFGQSRVLIPERMAITLDHAVPAPTTKHAQNHAEIRAFVAEQGIRHFFEAGRGICHQVFSEEALVLPGQLILGSDSHTTHFGWMGALGAGIGRSEVAVLWATGELWLRVPESMQIVLEGILPPGVTIKDFALRVMGDLGIEFHGHNDTGCAVANAYCALEAGATHVDTSVLGIGERNGITPLGGMIARMYTYDTEMIRRRYHLPLLREVENYVAGLVSVDVPFNNYITGYTAFTHKAGIHAKAILNNPSTYEILDPADFGLTRYIHVAHRLTGWNAIKQRAEQLQLNLTDDEIKIITTQIKTMADQKQLNLDDVDVLLRNYHSQSVMPDLLHVAEESAALVEVLA